MKKIIADLVKELDLSSDEPKKYSDEDRLNLLDINDSTAENIRNLRFEKTNFDESDYGETCYKVIAMDELVGINRQDNVGNWLELLFKLHKKSNFDLYTCRENFEKYVKHLDEKCNYLPHVLDINGKYFIDGDGKHRLTIAKCIGLECFPVVVTTVSKT